MKNLRDSSLAELEEMMAKLGEPKYRAKQVYEWIWQKSSGDINDMSNLPKALREKLSAEFTIPKVRNNHSQYSSPPVMIHRRSGAFRQV